MIGGGFSEEFTRLKTPGGRRRSAHDTTVSQVMAGISSSNGGGGGGGSYRPSFAPPTSSTKNLQDVNAVLEQRVLLGGRRSSGGGGGVQIRREVGNSGMVQTGSAMMPTLKTVPRAATQRSQSFNPPPPTGEHSPLFPNASRHHSSTAMVMGNRRTSLGLSYNGPVLSSLDNAVPSVGSRRRSPGSMSVQRQQQQRQNDDSLSLQQHQDNGMGGGGGGGQWPHRDAGGTNRPPKKNSPSPSVQNNISRSGPDIPRRESMRRNASFGGGGGGGATEPNTLTLDNWFEEDRGGQQQQQQTQQMKASPLHKSSSSTFELKDLDDSEMSAAGGFLPSRTQPKQRGGNNGVLAVGKPFTHEIGTSLKMLLFGAVNRVFPAGWLGQSFHFAAAKPRFGFVQHRGGPCGVMAALQAHLIRELAFGMPTRAVNPLSPTDREREEALAAAVVAVLSRCSSGGGVTLVLPGNRAHFAGLGRYKSDGVTETMSSFEFSSTADALAFARDNAAFYSCDGSNAVVALLYSAILTRGVGNVRSDMDSADLPLMAAHGYCSQEMVSLLLVGKAVSNTFDGDVDLDGTVLRGVPDRSDVGLLSLYEHYKSISVGENLKTPVFPIWLVCSESHFSVVFSDRTGNEKAGLADRGPVDVFFYDGLAMMENAVKLTLDCSRPRANLRGGDEEDLVPPLEHCLRTKWRDANIDWNGAEKIL